MGAQPLNQQQTSELWSEVWATFEDVRREIFNLMMDRQDNPADKKTAKKVM